jgi:hypothetical protein
MQRDHMESAMSARGWLRNLWLRAAQSPVPPVIPERMRDVVRKQIARDDQDRLSEISSPVLVPFVGHDGEGGHHSPADGVTTKS